AALREMLEVRGVLPQLRARMRAEVFRALDDVSETRPSPGPHMLLINQMIHEYLRFHKYHHTESVFTTESGQQDVPLDRTFIANELNIVEEPSTRELPLLYGVIAHFLN
ncbi:lisH domain-containing protein FOPNL, partial [Silurus meridionalis]